MQESCLFASKVKERKKPFKIFAALFKDAFKKSFLTTYYNFQVKTFGLIENPKVHQIFFLAFSSILKFFFYFWSRMPAFLNYPNLTSHGLWHVQSYFETFILIFNIFKIKNLQKIVQKFHELSLAYHTTHPPNIST